MTAETTLVATLEAITAITDLVDDRIYPIEAEQNKTLPYIVYELVSSVPVEAPDVTHETNESEIDIACHGASYAQAKLLAQLVRSGLIDDLDASVIENSQDQRDQETRSNCVIQTYRLWHVEAFP